MRKSNHKTIFHMDEANVDNLREALTGHSIKSIHYDRLVLDNDYVLTIEDSCECCAHYTGEFNWDGDPPDNVITNVVLDDHIQVGADEAFRIVVMAQNKRITDLSVIGNEGSGCYMKSVWFTVSKKTPTWREKAVAGLREFNQLEGWSLENMQEKPNEEVRF